MKCDNAFLLDEGRPLQPIPLDRFFPMVTINKKKIDRRIPATYRIPAESLNPIDACRASGIHRAARGTLQKIQRGNPGEMKRIDEMEGSTRGHCGAQCYCRGTFRNSDFDRGLRITGVAHQGLVFHQSVLRQRCTQPQPSKKRVSKKGTARAPGRRYMREFDLRAHFNCENLLYGKDT